MKRRQFLTSSIVGGTALTMGICLQCSKKENSSAPKLARRILGNTGERLPVIGFGGLIVRDLEQAYANDLVAKAFDRGVNYFDFAPTYGNAEDILGPALQSLRHQSFLACKTTQRDKAGSEKELNLSLTKLKTDHFDLYQVHGLNNVQEAEKCFAADGAMETFLKAKQAGKIRYLGFSAHSEEAALFAMTQFAFDTILFPINFVCWYQGNFGQRTIAKAKEKGMGILALKSLALTQLPPGKERPYARLWYQPVDKAEIAALAVRFALSQGATAMIPPGDELFFWQAVEIAESFSPITIEETEKLKKLSEGVVPIFKTS